MRWFRLYNDIVDDEKIAQIDGKTFKVFVFLMAVCSQNDSQSGILPDKKYLSWRLRMTEKKIELALMELESHGIVDQANGAITIVNWHKRQFKSDNINERVARYRNAKKEKDVTLHETLSVSPQNRTEQNRTDTEKNKRVRATFQPPSLDEVRAYIQEKNFQVNPEGWTAHYEANGWMVGKNKMKDWKAAIRTWQHNGYGQGTRKPATHERIQANTEEAKPFSREELIRQKEALLEQYRGRKEPRLVQVSQAIERELAELRQGVVK